MADLGHVGIDRRQVSALHMTRAEFDDFQSAYRDLDLTCVECGGGMYPKRSFLRGGYQLFAHMPGTLETCPARRNETLTHHDLKELVAHIGEEQLGLRALIDERKFVGLKPDVMLFDANKPEDNGPRHVYEIQHSPLDVATFDNRSKRLNAGLQRLSSGAYDRRVAPWLFTHQPAYAASRAHIEVTQALDETWNVIGGVYTDATLEHVAAADLATTMTAMHAGRTVRLDDRLNGQPISYWTTLAATQKTARRAPRPSEIPRQESPACTRPPATPTRQAPRTVEAPAIERSVPPRPPIEPESDAQIIARANRFGVDPDAMLRGIRMAEEAARENR